MKQSTQPKTSGRRLSPDQREQQIVERAIEYFSTYGFSGSTRELAKQIGVTQPLLYRYFPSKEILIERVYNEVYCWDSSWNKQITDPDKPLRQKLIELYSSYAKTILTREWIRIFIFAGLDKEGINKKYLSKLREQIFIPVLTELHKTFDIPMPTEQEPLEEEVELIWSLHASIFYLGVRKWIYGLEIPKDINLYIEQHIDAFLEGTPIVIQKLIGDNTN